MKLKAAMLIDKDWFTFPFILHLLEDLELITCKCRRKCIPGECFCIELDMMCTETYESHNSKKFWNKEANLVNTMLDDDVFELENASLKNFINFLNNTFYILLLFCCSSALCYNLIIKLWKQSNDCYNHLIVSATWLLNCISVL